MFDGKIKQIFIMIPTKPLLLTLNAMWSTGIIVLFPPSAIFIHLEFSSTMYVSSLAFYSIILESKHSFFFFDI